LTCNPKAHNRTVPITCGQWWYEVAKQQQTPSQPIRYVLIGTSDGGGVGARV
jgi:hypothetical protein